MGDAPHRSVIWFYAETHELLPTGECSGKPVEKIKQFPIGYLDGKSKEEAVSKLQQLISEVKKSCLKNAPP